MDAQLEFRRLFSAAPARGVCTHAMHAPTHRGAARATHPKHLHDGGVIGGVEPGPCLRPRGCLLS